jgi:esterase/lipase superfamily enzyme
MADLQSMILALTDSEAMALLRRFVRAVATGSPTPEAVRQQAKAMANELSLAAGPDAVMAPGDLARSALLMLASDARFQSSLHKMLSSTPGAFSRATEQVDATDLLAVLQTQLTPPAESADSSVVASTTQPPGLMRTLARHLLSYAGLQPQGPESDAEYLVWYATSRKPLNAADPSQGFGAERDDRIHHGTCRVFIPRSHKVGSTGSPWWKRLATFSDDRMRLLSIDSLPEAAFWQQMRDELANGPIDDQDAVVFIHGFNVDFQEAALRAAQIGFDLQIRGTVAFYSWASRGDVKMYLADEATVELEEAPIADFLCDMALRTGARRVHVIAHSMGNRAVLRAMHQITQQAERRSGVRFGQVILAAADVDARKFHELCQAYRELSERTTLYVSSRDAAVELSRRLHDFPRVGLMPPITTTPGIDTVNAVNADVSLLGHGYVAEARDVISDMHALIRHGTAPRQRFGLRSATTPAGEPYWLIGA